MTKKRQLEKAWLTDFCGSLHVFVSIIMIQIVVLIYALSFLSFDLEFFRKLSILTLLAQLSGLTLLIVLCKLRHLLNQLEVIKGMILVVSLVIIITSFIAQVIGYLDIQLAFDLLKNQQNINLLNVKLSVAAVLICLALIRYFYIQDQWNHQVRKLSDAQLHALQARIKPHFLFNTLNSIASLISFDTDRAEQAIVDFSSLMRRAFTHQDRMISVAQELEWVKQYLAIEKLRLGERLDFCITCDDQLYQKKIPVLCLQPLVENAILHGIQPLEDGGLIDVKLSLDDDILIININNPYIDNALGPINGVALNNIRERLFLEYGEKASMQISKNDGFFEITLKIPK